MGGGSSSSNWSGGSSQGRTTSNARTTSEAQTKSQATGESVVHTTSRVSGGSRSHTSSHMTSHSETDTVGRADTTSEADTRSHAVGRSHAEGVGRSSMAGRSTGQMVGGTISRGVVPALSINRSWQLEDDVAAHVAETIRGLERVLDAASHGGGFMSQVTVFVEDRGAEKLAAAAVGQAWHGPNVPTPIGAWRVPDEDLDAVRAYVLACRPSELTDGDTFGGLLWTRYATLLSAEMLAALTRPAWMEHGPATVVQEEEPAYALCPELEGEVFLGRQYSHETGELTDVPLLLSRERMFHSLFTGNTGMGKSVAAQRMAYETTLHWHFRTIALDFSTGWRDLAGAPGLEGHFDLYQLSPGGTRPLRWNPLEIGRHVDPEMQWRGFCDVFGGIARMGVRRQVHDFRRVLKRVYVNAGVLVRDPEVQTDPEWGYVRGDEEPLVHVAPGTSIKELQPEALQMLAVHRSKAVGLADLYREVQEELASLPPSDRIGRPIMEGIQARLEPLIEGTTGKMFGAGEGTVAVSDLAQPWGMCVIEGGDALDEFSKTFLLAWFGWHAYQDAYARHAKKLAAPDETVQIFYEELNKILSGIGGGDEEGGGGDYLIEQLSQQWLDSRKARAWLHGITQVPSLIPRAVRQSCANVFFANASGADDRDIEVGALARSEKGFTDEAVRRWLARLPIGQVVVKLGYTQAQCELEPMKIRPAMLALPKLDDDQLAKKLPRRSV
jgi:hypothetical protein